MNTPWAARVLLKKASPMQDGFFQKVTLCIIVGASLAGLIEFYKTFVEGADQAINGHHPKVHMNMGQPKN